MTTPEPPEPPLRELSAFVGATRPARSRKERIEMTTPEPSPLAPKELDELEGKLSRLTRSCQCEECRDERSAIRESLRRLIAQARAARPSPWLLSRADAEDKLTDAVGRQMFGLTPWVKKCLLDWLFAQNDRPSPPAQDGGRP